MVYICLSHFGKMSQIFSQAIYINNFGKCGHRRAVGVRVGTHMKHVITDKREVGLL